MKFKYLIIFFLCCVDFSINRHMIFDFHTNIDLNKVNEENYMNSTMAQKIYTDFYIGTPSQKIPMTIKTGQYPTFLTSPSCEKVQVQFDQNKSISYHQINNIHSQQLFLLDFLSGYYSNDSLLINSSYTFDNFTFMLATELPVSIKNISGEIGLSIRPDISGTEAKDNKYLYSGKTGFIKNLKDNGLIDQPMFGIIYDDEYNGKLIIGDFLHNIDDLYKESDYFSGRADFMIYIEKKEKYWMLETELFNGNYSENTYIYLEYEIGLIYGSSQFDQNITQKYFEEKKCERKIISSNPYSFFQYSCDTKEQFADFPDLKFEVNGYTEKITFNFTKDELFKQIGKKYIFLIVFEVTEENKNYWRFGQIFFRKYNLFLHWVEKDNRFVFYPKKERKEKGKGIDGGDEEGEGGVSTQIIIIIILAIVVAILASVIIVYWKFFYKKEKKRPANEMKDDYEYNGSEENDKSKSLVVNNNA